MSFLEDLMDRKRRFAHLYKPDVDENTHLRNLVKQFAAEVKKQNEIVEFVMKNFAEKQGYIPPSPDHREVQQALNQENTYLRDVISLMVKNRNAKSKNDYEREILELQSENVYLRQLISELVKNSQRDRMDQIRQAINKFPSQY